MMLPTRTLLISGHARLPHESAAKTSYDILSITAEVDIESTRVLAADVTLVTETARNFVRSLLVGKRAVADAAAVADALDFGYQGGAKKAVLAAVAELHRNAAAALNAVHILAVNMGKR